MRSLLCYQINQLHVTLLEQNNGSSISSKTLTISFYSRLQMDISTGSWGEFSRHIGLAEFWGFTI